MSIIGNGNFVILYMFILFDVILSWNETFSSKSIFPNIFFIFKLFLLGIFSSWFAWFTWFIEGSDKLLFFLYSAIALLYNLFL